MVTEIFLAHNDERLGTVDATRTLVYPACDVFGHQYDVRTSMQVVWVAEDRFVVFPFNVNVADYAVYVKASLTPDELVILERINDDLAAGSDTLRVTYSVSSEGEAIIHDVASVEPAITTPEPEPKPDPKPTKKRGK